MPKKIPTEILQLLDDCTIEGKTLFLPQQLDRKTYVKIDKVIKNMGGKWNRKAKGHLFDEDPSDLLEEVMLTGETVDLQKEYQFFPTPTSLAEVMVTLADIQPTDVLLEPSAGKGHIADCFPKENEKILIELNEQNVAALKEKGYDVQMGDFLETKEIVVDKIIMNPPFTKQQDIDHILHAFSCLKDGGKLVSVVSESPFFRTNHKSKMFRDFLTELDAEVIKLPEATFKDSGTMVNTRMITVRKGNHNEKP